MIRQKWQHSISNVKLGHRYFSVRINSKQFPVNFKLKSQSRIILRFQLIRQSLNRLVLKCEWPTVRVTVWKQTQNLMICSTFKEKLKFKKVMLTIHEIVNSEKLVGKFFWKFLRNLKRTWTDIALKTSSYPIALGQSQFKFALQIIKHIYRYPDYYKGTTSV